MPSARSLVVAAASVVALLSATPSTHSADLLSADSLQTTRVFADPAPTKSPALSDAYSRPNSILLFGGRMSTTDIYSTMALNLNRSSGQKYDNNIVGFAYSRDIFAVGYGFYLGAEIGAADRFGHYKSCCDTVVWSDAMTQSPEVWAGAQLRYAGFTFFQAVKVGGGITFGASVINSPMGREAQWARENGSSNHILYYFGPELDVAFTNLPNVEFVLRLHHRSGGKTVLFLPTIAGQGEGYNANVVGVRYRF
jgi:hypothetical protein